MAFTVAIAGRPNVGKSTLFNRLIGKAAAIVDNTPGVTRDWREGEAKHLGLRVLDTAGLDDAKSDGLAERIQKQTRGAIEQSDALIFLIDGRDGVTPFDHQVAQLLRRAGKPIVLAVNKCDTTASKATIAEAERLGFGEAVELSAAHGTGIEDLYRALMALAPDELHADQDEEESEGDGETPRTLTIAITGRPNAGKSTLLNRFLGSERSITGPEAGITRDAVAAEWMWEGRKVRLIDTAGLRRKAKVDADLEKLSVASAIEEIKMAEVVILVVDAAIPFETQDLQIADLVEREGRAMVVAVNKWDLVEDKAQLLKTLKSRVDELLPQWKGVPIVAISALSGEGVERLMPAVLKQHEIWNRRISTHKLNDWLAMMLERHSPPAPKGRRIKIRYITQARTRPPTFAISSSQAGELPGDYGRYLVNGLREHFGFDGVPIRMKVKAGENPFDSKRRK
jgi:GTP-binding protein